MLKRVMVLSLLDWCNANVTTAFLTESVQHVVSDTVGDAELFVVNSARDWNQLDSHAMEFALVLAFAVLVGDGIFESFDLLSQCFGLLVEHIE